MITLCSVIYDLNNRYIKYFLENIKNKTKLITEINLCNLDHDESYSKKYNIGNISVREFGLKNTKTLNGEVVWDTLNMHICRIGASMSHSFAMVQAVEMASNPFVYMSDPDLLFYTNVDSIYYDLLTKYDLTFIGGAHHIGINYSCKFFPNVVNLLVKKENLPPPNTFDINVEDVMVDNPGLLPKHKYLFVNNYLCPGRHKSVIDNYPNPEGHTDTGMLLYEWNERINGKWMSFLTSDVHNYTTQFYRTNFKLKEKLPTNKLFYHVTHAAFETSAWDRFLKINGEIND
jgi:hypothetical protein